MKTNYLIHLSFILVSALAASAIASQLPGEGSTLLGMGIGAALGSALVGVARLLEKNSGRRLLWGMLGLSAGVVSGGTVSVMASPLFALSPAASLIWQGGAVLSFTYFGLIVALKMERDSGIAGQMEQPSGTLKILDTSVIIDGRIADLCETGFLEGAFLTPQFILQELQHIADSSDSMKRARGRRGLDVLQRLKEMPHIEVRIVDTDFPAIREVDAKIVALAKQISAKVVTNDLNLNKVAELQGVQVLNINQLCNALKPVVLPGEVMEAFVLKEGKELGQGIAYLDDGTMIVIDEARKWIGKTVQITVTSVLQTPAGRMIFSRLKEGPSRPSVSVVRGGG